MSKIDEFRGYRKKMNKAILDGNDKVVKRLFSVDVLAYSDGALSAKTKEMLGLVSSMVLRCDDCIKYHLEECFELGVTDKEIHEVFGIAMLVGGSIVIPHARRAVEFWLELSK